MLKDVGGSWNEGKWRLPFHVRIIFYSDAANHRWMGHILIEGVKHVCGGDLSQKVFVEDVGYVIH
jgi:hypothetical protein